MSKHLSIKQRLIKAKSAELKSQLAHEWARSWRDEQMGLVVQLDRAQQARDWGSVISVAGQLHEVTTKRFASQAAILDHLLSFEQDDAAGGGT